MFYFVQATKSDSDWETDGEESKDIDYEAVDAMTSRSKIKPLPPLPKTNTAARATDVKYMNVKSREGQCEPDYEILDGSTRVQEGGVKVGEGVVNIGEGGSTSHKSRTLRSKRASSRRKPRQPPKVKPKPKLASKSVSVDVIDSNHYGTIWNTAPKPPTRERKAPKEVVTSQVEELKTEHMPPLPPKSK